MTGLPGQPAPPPALPDLDAVAALIDRWRAGLDLLASADATISSRGAASGWAGPAAVAARSAGDGLAHGLAEAVLDGARTIRSLEEWSDQLAPLSAERDHLLRRIDGAAAEVARLTLVPDNTFASPVLRTRAWQQHADLCADLAAWQARLSAADRAAIEALAAPAPFDALAADRDPRHRDAAESTRRALAEAAAAGVPAHLLTYEPDAFNGDGAVVIAFGDPVAAAHTGVVVPGITNDAATIDLQSLGAMSIEAAAAARSARACTIAWVGYDAPSHPALHGGRIDPRELKDLIRTAGEGAAEDGGHELVEFVDEVRETNPLTDVTVIGHSYGSTTTAHAAVDGLATDRLVVLGSPGLGDEVDRVGDLGLPDGAVFVGAADRDPVTWLGGPHRLAGHEVDTHGVGLGDDPTKADFGATRIAGAAGREFHLDSLDELVLNHNSYFEPGSTFVESIAAVVVGQQPAVVPRRTASGDALMGRWTVGEVMHETSRWWPGRG